MKEPKSDLVYYANYRRPGQKKKIPLACFLIETMSMELTVSDKSILE